MMKRRHSSPSGADHIAVANAKCNEGANAKRIGATTMTTCILATSIQCRQRPNSRLPSAPMRISHGGDGVALAGIRWLLQHECIDRTEGSCGVL